MMEKLHWFGWGFSREVQVVNRFHLHMVFSYSYLYSIMKLIAHDVWYGPHMFHAVKLHHLMVTLS